jgi:hypothetical protein
MDCWFRRVTDHARFCAVNQSQPRSNESRSLGFGHGGIIAVLGRVQTSSVVHER